MLFQRGRGLETMKLIRECDNDVIIDSFMKCLGNDADIYISTSVVRKMEKEAMRAGRSIEMSSDVAKNGQECSKVVATLSKLSEDRKSLLFILAPNGSESFGQIMERVDLNGRNADLHFGYCTAQDVGRYTVTCVQY